MSWKEGGEVVEDDAGGEDGEEAAEEGQESVHLHPTGDVLEQCLGD